MSYISFQSESEEEVTISGRERRHGANLCAGMLNISLGLDHWLCQREVDIFKGIMPENDLNNMDNTSFLEAFKIWINVSNKYFLVNDVKYDLFALQLNTGLIIGSDAVKLLAKLHGQCELHCYVEGQYRKPLAELITKGIEQKILHNDVNWSEVIILLNKKENEPVICSYSVCESFPNYNCLPDSHVLKLRQDEERFEDFYEIPGEEAWQLCIGGLREQQALSIIPDKLEDDLFLHRHTGMSLREIIFNNDLLTTKGSVVHA